jgi:hypothetical protein
MFMRKLFGGSTFLVDNKTKLYQVLRLRMPEGVPALQRIPSRRRGLAF